MVVTEWDNLVATSYYETISTIEERIKQYDYDEALIGLEHLYENMAKKDKREFRAFLELVMMHILKWKTQPLKRSTSWAKTIRNGRKEMRVILEDIPSINKDYIQEIWQVAFDSAVEDAKYEMNFSKNEKQNFNPEMLTWQEVFEDEYYLEND
jgi:hypothetical protein